MGNLDFVTADITDSGGYIHLGNGDGSFTAGTFLSVAGTPRDVVAGDFNNDGNQDIAFTHNNTYVFLGNGDGTFKASKVYSTGTNVYEGEAADFNNDGNLDIVTIDRTSDYVSIQIGNGDGSFKARWNATILTADPETMAVGDFDSDGNMTLLSVHLRMRRPTFCLAMEMEL